MPETFTRWDPLEYLTTDDDLRRYLAAAAAEDAGDGNLIRAALKDIVRSGNFAGLPGAVGISRQSLDQALDKDGNPSFTTIARAITALGMQIQITPARRPPDVIIYCKHCALTLKAHDSVSNQAVQISPS